MLEEEESILSIATNGDKYWKNKNGSWHRLDGPAIEYINGTKYWFNNDKQHRIDGPAVEWSRGGKEWFLRGQHFESKEAFFEALTDKEKKIAIFSEAFHNA